MADQNRGEGDRWGTRPVEPSTVIPETTGRGGGVDPATHTVDMTPGPHTGREDTRYRHTKESDTMDRMQNQTQDIAGRAEGTAENMAHRAEHKAEHLADKAKDKAVSQLSSQKNRATESLGEVSDALRQTGKNLRNKNENMVAGYLDDAAGYVDDLSGYLRNHSVNDMMNQAQGMARREPALFIGGAFALGLLGARFLKSSTPTQNDYGRGSYTGSYRSDGYGQRNRNFRGQTEDEFGAYVPGGVAGDYTRTHESDPHRVGSAAERALGRPSSASYSQDLEDNR